MRKRRARAKPRRPRQRRALETVDVILRATTRILSRDGAERLIHGVALRAPERLADDDFAVELTDLLVRYLVH